MGHEMVFIDVKEIEELLSVYRDKPIMAIPRSAIKAEVVNFSSWVDNVYVEKNLPNTLNVWVSEKPLTLCIRSKGKYIYVSGDEIVESNEEGQGCERIYYDYYSEDLSEEDYLYDKTYQCARNIMDYVGSSSILSEFYKGAKYNSYEKDEISIVNTKSQTLVPCKVDYLYALSNLERAFVIYPRYYDYGEFIIYNDRIVAKKNDVEEMLN